MNLAKSLHTITVYERLIAHFTSSGMQPTDAVARTKEVLGHTDMTDTYGLVEKAVAKTQKCPRS